MRFITSKEQLKEANSAVATDLDLSSVRSYITNAEMEVLQVVGEATAVQIEGNTVALAMLRMVVVDLALANYSSSGAIQMDNAGIFVVKSDRKLPASDKKLLAFKQDAIERAWKNFEILVGYLEGNSSIFTAWKSSDQRKSYFSTLFANSGEFGSFGGIGVSASLFRLLKPLIERIEEDVLSVNYGEALIADLREKRLNGVMSAALKKLERKMMRVVAPLAMAEAIPLQLVRIQEGGVFQASIVAGGTGTDNVEALSIAQQNRLAMVLGKLSSEGEAMVVKVKDWLNEHTSDYPLYVSTVRMEREDINEQDSNVYLL